jgi:hypothetical protein
MIDRVPLTYMLRPRERQTFNDKLNRNQQHSNPDCINVFIYCNHTILMRNCDIT